MNGLRPVAHWGIRLFCLWAVFVMLTTAIYCIGIGEWIGVMIFGFSVVGWIQITVESWDWLDGSVQRKRHE